MKYEYDSNKSLSNKQKHGIDFEDAKLLWNDDRMVEILTSYEDEERFINIGKINSKFYTVVTTIREKEKIRIISARRARKRPNLEPKRINIDFPTWMVKKLDEEAQHIGVSRQAIIKTWLADKLLQNEHHKVAV